MGRLPFHLIVGSGVTVVVSAIVVAWARARADRLAARRRSAFAANTRPPSLPAPTTIAFLGDVQKGVRSVARSVVAAIACEGATLLVSSGDLASHGEPPYHGIVAHAFERAGLQVPILVVPGNHDVQPRGVRESAAGLRAFEAFWGPGRFVATVGPLVVIGADNSVAPLDEASLDWLDERLGERPGRPWILVVHRPPRDLVTGERPTDALSTRLLEILSRRPPERVISGHLANDTERVLDGVRYVVNAEGGDVSGDPLFASRTFRLLVASVDERGLATWRRVELARVTDCGITLDQLAVRIWSDSRRGVARVFAVLGDGVRRVLSRREPAARSVVSPGPTPERPDSGAPRP